MSLKSFRCQVLDAKKKQVTDQLIIAAPTQEALEKILKNLEDGTPGGVIRDILTATVPNPNTVKVIKEDTPTALDLVLPWSFIQVHYTVS